VVTTLRDAEIGDVEAALGHEIIRDVRPSVVDVGAVWIVGQLPSVESLLRLTPDFARCAARQRFAVATWNRPHRSPKAGG